MLEVAIVEDEERDARRLEEYLARYARENGREIAVSRYGEAISLLENYTARFSVILMDIELPLLNGMDAARKLRQVDTSVCLVFITNMAQFACEGYGVDALDFIVKPVSYADFYLKFSRAVSRADASSDDEFHIRVAGGVRRVRACDIAYVEVRSHSVLYHTEQGVIESRDTLATVEERLRPARFLRCAKSYLVNPRHITAVDGAKITVGDEVLYISGNRRRSFLKEFTAWQTGRG